MRDEVLAELAEEEGGLVFRVSELPLVLEAIRYGDRNLFEKNTQLDKTPVFINFRSTNNRFNKVEDWGTVAYLEVKTE